MNTPQIVGILNVTPDSYFDGGKYNHIESARAQYQKMIEDGADIIDIGGESTGPGSENVSLQEELSRVIPVLKALQTTNDKLPISIDTYKAEVAKQAIEAGASIVNDVTAGRGDPEMFSVLSQYDIPVILMYSKDSTGRTTIKDVDYHDVVATISAFLLERIEAAQQAGIDRSRIIIDPGQGHFISAKPEYSWQVIDHLSEFAEIAPVFISPSRKSFLAGSSNLPPSGRLEATVEASLKAIQNGATYLRTHDVHAINAALDLQCPPSKESVDKYCK